MICEKIREIFKASKKTYGSPRIYEELKDLGIKVCENTVAKYMQEIGLDARLKKRDKSQRQTEITTILSWRDC